MDRKSQEDGFGVDETTTSQLIDSGNSPLSVAVDGSDGGGDALARGLSAMLSSVLKEFDSKSQGTLRSQDELSDCLDRLVRELDQLLENAPSPFIMQHAIRISSVKKRIFALNSLLKSIQRRVDNIDQVLSIAITHEKATTESS